MSALMQWYNINITMWCYRSSGPHAVTSAGLLMSINTGTAPGRKPSVNVLVLALPQTSAAPLPSSLKKPEGSDLEVGREGMKLHIA